MQQEYSQSPNTPFSSLLVGSKNAILCYILYQAECASSTQKASAGGHFLCQYDSHVGVGPTFIPGFLQPFPLTVTHCSSMHTTQATGTY